MCLRVDVFTRPFGLAPTAFSNDGHTFTLYVSLVVSGRSSFFSLKQVLGLCFMQYAQDNILQQQFAGGGLNRVKAGVAAAQRRHGRRSVLVARP